MFDRRWSILVVLFLARTAMGFQFQSISSVSSFLITDLHIGYAAIGTLVGLYMMPGILLAFPGGLLNRRFGDKAVCVAGLALMMVGGALAGVGSGAILLFVGRLTSGIGAVLFSLVLTKMITDWFAGREIVLAMGVVLASWPFGIAAALLLQPPLASMTGWRWVMQAAAALCAGALLLIVAAYRNPPGAARPKPDHGSVLASALPPWRQVLPTLVAALMWGGLNLALVLYFSFAPGLLTRLGAPAVTAARWTGAALWVVMFSLPLASFAVQRLGRPDAAIVVFGLLGGLALAILPSGIAPLALGLAFGVAVGPPAGAIMALPARVLGAEHRASGLGIFFTVYYVILTFGSALAGVLREFWGAAAPLLFAAGLMASLAALVGLFQMLARAAERGP